MKNSLTLIFITLCQSFFQLAAEEKISESFYKENYGVVTASENELVASAQNIFDKIYKASALKSPARLIVLPKQAESWEKWIGTLSNGNVVMVESALRLCFEPGEPLETGEARLAFILGHELAHLANRDHMKKLSYSKLPFMSGKKAKPVSRDDHREQSEFEKIEKQADFKGLLFMTMAGFNPEHITYKDSFFRQYQDKIRKRGLIANESYPGTEERTENLKNKIAKMALEIDLFRRGLEQYRRGLYGEAAKLFKKFGKVFGGREVWNNLGLSYYQRAMKTLSLLDKKELMRFRLSTVVDTETLASRLIHKGESTIVERDVYDKLNEAKVAFRMAIQLDSEYMPARINLSSVLIRMKQYEDALDELEEALEINPGSLPCLINKAVALYLSDKEKHWGKARKTLDGRIPLESPYYSQALYNHNVIREELLRCASKSWVEQKKVCKPLWTDFLSLEPEGPYSRMIEKNYKYREKRIALVVGNGNYSKAYLGTPLRDAVGVASVLHDLGFEVHLRQNVDRKEMKKAIWSFGKRISEGGAGLFYYSGHGVQIEGNNYLVPLKAEIVVPRQAELEFVRVDEVLAQMEAAGNRLNIVLLDACRNNPFSGLKGGSKGLGAPPNVPKGTIIGYATAPGGVALGVSDDGYSPYTRELLEYMTKPGLKIEDMFKKVRQAVTAKTNGLQKPWETTSMEGDFYFNPSKEDKFEIVPLEKTGSGKIVVPSESLHKNDYSWIWHSTAITLTAGSLYVAYQANREYEKLSEENEDLKEGLYENEDLKESRRILMGGEYESNKQKMDAAQTQFLTASYIAIAALIWEIYLIVKDDERKETAFKSSNLRYAVIPQASGDVRLSLSWRF